MKKNTQAGPKTTKESKISTIIFNTKNIDLISVLMAVKNVFGDCKIINLRIEKEVEINQESLF